MENVSSIEWKEDANDDERSLTLPLHWKRYKPLNILGRGGFGVVYLCFDTTSIPDGETVFTEKANGFGNRRSIDFDDMDGNRTSYGNNCYVAVKAVSLASLSDEDILAAMNEIAILKCIAQQSEGLHEHNFFIVKYLDSFMDEKENSLCIVTEFMDGGDVDDLIKEYRNKNKKIEEPVKNGFHSNVLTASTAGGITSHEVTQDWGGDASFMPDTPPLGNTSIEFMDGTGISTRDGADWLFGSKSDDAASLSIPKGHQEAQFSPNVDGPACWLSSHHISQILKQALVALRFLHDNNIIHRDIKSSNLYLNKNRSIVKVGDFGVAKMLGTGGGDADEEEAFTSIFTKTFVGTPFYISPEICLGEFYTFSTDLWSLGVVAYEMYTLTLPFYAENLLAQIHLVTEGNYNKTLLEHPHIFTEEEERNVREALHDDLYFAAGKEQLQHFLIQTLVAEMLNTNPFERLSSSELLETVFGAMESEEEEHAATFMGTKMSVSEIRPGNRKPSMHTGGDIRLSVVDLEEEMTRLYDDCLTPSIRASVSLTSRHQTASPNAATAKGFERMTQGSIKSANVLDLWESAEENLDNSSVEHDVDLSSFSAPMRGEALDSYNALASQVPWLLNADIFSKVPLSLEDDNVVRVDVRQNKKEPVDGNSSSHSHTSSISMNLVSFGRAQDMGVYSGKEIENEKMLSVRPPTRTDLRPPTRTSISLISPSDILHRDLYRETSSTRADVKEVGARLGTNYTAEDDVSDNNSVEFNFGVSRLRPISAHDQCLSGGDQQLGEGDALTRLSRSPPPPAKSETPMPEKKGMVPSSGAATLSSSTLSAAPVATTASKNETKSAPDIEHLLRCKLQAAHLQRRAYLKKMRQGKNPKGENPSHIVYNEELKAKLREQLNQLYALNYQRHLRSAILDVPADGPANLKLTQKPVVSSETASPMSFDASVTKANIPVSSRFSSANARLAKVDLGRTLPEKDLLDDTISKIVLETTARHGKTIKSNRSLPYNSPTDATIALTDTEQESVFSAHILSSIKSVASPTREYTDDEDLIGVAETFQKLLQTEAIQEFLQQAKEAAEIETNKIKFQREIDGEGNVKTGWSAKRVELIPPYRKPRWELHDENNTYGLLWESSSVEDSDPDIQIVEVQELSAETASHKMYNKVRGQPKSMESVRKAVPPEELYGVRRWRWSCPPSDEEKICSSSSSSSLGSHTTAVSDELDSVEHETESGESDLENSQSHSSDLSTSSSTGEARGSSATISNDSDNNENFVYVAYYQKKTRRRYFNYTLPVTLQIVSENEWNALIGETKSKASKSSAKKKQKLGKKSETLHHTNVDCGKQMKRETNRLLRNQKEELKSISADNSSAVTTKQSPSPQADEVDMTKAASAEPKTAPNSGRSLEIIGSNVSKKQITATKPPAKELFIPEGKTAPKAVIAQKAALKKKCLEIIPPQTRIGQRTLPLTLMLTCIRPRTRLSGILFRFRRALSAFPDLVVVLQQINDIFAHQSQKNEQSRIENEHNDNSSNNNDGCMEITSNESEEDEETATQDSSSSSANSAKPFYADIAFRELPLFYYDPQLVVSGDNDPQHVHKKYIPLQSEAEWKRVQTIWWETDVKSKNPFMRLYYVWKE